MSLQTVLFGLAAVVLLALVRFAWVWRKYGGRRAIECPENHRPAGVVLNAGHAARTALFSSPDLRLSQCTRWPEKRDCGQQCLAQIAASPEGCLVRNILTSWYLGKTCVSCGQPFTDIEWSRKPALLTAEKVSMEWDQVPADKLSEVLSASAPLCFACHMASTLVREHPDLAIERSTSEIVHR